MSAAIDGRDVPKGSWQSCASCGARTQWDYGGCALCGHEKAVPRATDGEGDTETLQQLKRRMFEENRIAENRIAENARIDAERAGETPLALDLRIDGLGPSNEDAST